MVQLTIIDADQVDSKLSSMSVAVSGHRGFIGRDLVEALQVSQAVVLPVEGDVCSPGTWNGSYDILYHLAAATPDRFVGDTNNGFYVNIGGVIQALEACRERGAHMVFISTSGVYSPSALGALGEDALKGPQTPYARSKFMGEELCREYAMHYGVKCTILRLFNVYGAGQRSPYLIPYLLECAVTGREAVINEPHSGRDFIYIADVVNALKTVVLQQDLCETFNIGYGESRTIAEVIAAVQSTSGKPLAWSEKVHAGQREMTTYYANVDRAYDKLNWCPAVSFSQGLEKIFARVANVHQGMS
jgi:nucleoside-diphosphate-sugar epimerase